MKRATLWLLVLVGCGTKSEEPDSSSTYEPECGNGLYDAATEDCDGSDLGGFDCQMFGFVEGTLRCDSECAYDMSECF